MAGLKIGATSAQVKRRLGSPRETGDSASGGRFWIYSCESDCSLLVLIDGGRLRMASASSESTHRKIRTTAGTFLGLATWSAEKRERARTSPGCVTELARERSGYTLEVAVSGGRVNSISLRDNEYRLDC